MPILTISTIMGDFDIKRYKALLLVYNTALGRLREEDRRWTVFEDRPYLVDFLKYLLEYLNPHFQPIIDSENESEAESS